MVYFFIKEKEDSEIIKIFNGVKNPNFSKKFGKRTYNEVVDRVSELQRNLGAEVNLSKDFTDNHKYNHIRERMYERKRKEDGSTSNKF